MEITLELVERLREKTNVSYGQAKQALEYSGGNLLDAIIYLEEQGVIPREEGAYFSTRSEMPPPPPPPSETMSPLVEKKGRKEKREETKTKALRTKMTWPGDSGKSVFTTLRRWLIDNELEIWRKEKPITALPVLILVLLLIFAGYNGMYAWGKFMAVPAVLTQVTYLPWAQPLSMNRRLRKMGFEPASQPYQTPKAGMLNYPLAPMACSPDEKPNILLVLIDSWRADSFTPEIMPHLYGAYKESPDAFYFTNHLAGGNATEAGVFSLMYSMPYSYWDAVTGAKVRPVLMDVLAKQGYEFGIYASSRLNSPEFNQNVFSHIPDLRISSYGEAKWERDEDAQKDFLAFLDQRDNGKPFFGFLFYEFLFF